MKKIIPFKKRLSFNTNVSEITSIALENTLQYRENKIDGDLIVNGNYKITDTSIKVDGFEFKIPIEIEIDNKYITDNIIIDIDDFYYEIINNNILEVNVDVMKDNIIEKPIIDQVQEETLLLDDLREELEKMETENKIEQLIIKEETNRCIEEETVVKENIVNKENKVNNDNIFDYFNNDKEDYSTYHVYIVREGDTIESIMNNYAITRELLNEYNDLSELKLGDKLIIPQI